MNQTKRDVIISELRRLILSGELARGSRLPQDELAVRFGSSITPVREALRALEAESLVVSEPHRGVTVAGIDFDRFKATYIVRRLTESYAIRRAAIRMSPHELRKADELLASITAASHEGHPDEVSEANKAFHFYLYERCGIPALMVEIDSLWHAFPWDLILSGPGGSARSEIEHREVLDAMRRADPDAAGAAMERHLERSFAELMVRYTNENAPDPFDINND